MSIALFHYRNPFGVMRQWMLDLSEPSLEGMIALEAVALLLIVGLLWRSSARLREHFQERHYRPLLDLTGVDRGHIGDRPLSWWAVRRVMEYSGRVNLWLAGGFGILYAAYTITALLMQARATGVGGYIDCSMLGSLLGVAAPQTSEYFGTGNSGRRLGSAHPRNAPYQAYMAKDDYFIIAAGNDALWREVAEAVGLPHLVDDPRFKSQLDRAHNYAALAEILEAEFLKRTATEWLTEMDRRGVPCAPINSYPEILADPHVESMGLVRPLRLPNGVETRTIAFPVAISGYEFAIDQPPPELGVHSEDVASERLSEATVTAPARRAVR